jgi:APA family basic amino acid/polyamine antiporter
VTPKPGVSAGSIGAFTAACVLVSNAVGSGVFTTTGFMARDLGDPLLILALWALGGVLALAGSLAYAELGAALPRSGGEYVYLTRAYGPTVGYLSGWTSLLLGFGAAIAAAGVAFAAFVGELSPALAERVDPRLIAIGLVWTLTALHARGTATGGRLQRALTWFKVGGIALLFGLAAYQAELGGRARGSFTGLRSAGAGAAPGDIAVSLVFVLYAYSGWNAAAYVAGEIARPARNLPRALVGGTLFVTALYLLINLVYLRALPLESLAAEPVLPVAEKAVAALLGAAAGGWLSALLCVSIAGAASAMIWVGPRVYREMAVDGAFPRWLAADGAAGVPTRALVLQSVWVSALIATGSFEQLVVYGGVPLAIFSALAVASAPVLRWREPWLARPFRAPLSPFVPLAYAAAALGIAAYSAWARPLEVWLAAATVLIGLPLRRLWSGRARGDALAVERRRAPS